MLHMYIEIRCVLAQVRPTRAAWQFLQLLLSDNCVSSLRHNYKRAHNPMHVIEILVSGSFHTFAKVGVVAISNKAHRKRLPKKTKLMIY